MSHYNQYSIMLSGSILYYFNLLNLSLVNEKKNILKGIYLLNELTQLESNNMN